MSLRQTGQCLLSGPGGPVNRTMAHTRSRKWLQGRSLAMFSAPGVRGSRQRGQRRGSACWRGGVYGGRISWFMLTSIGRL